MAATEETWACEETRFSPEMETAVRGATPPGSAPRAARAARGGTSCYNKMRLQCSDSQKICKWGNLQELDPGFVLMYSANTGKATMTKAKLNGTQSQKNLATSIVIY